MKPPADGWDRDEREALEPIESELAVIRDRHAGDPPLTLLRAASADALPPDAQARVSEHLAESAWSRALVAGVDDAEPSLDAAAEDRLLARIAQAQVNERSWFSLGRQWAALLATGALVALIAVVWMSRRAEAPTATAPSAGPVATVAGNEPPRFELPLQKPEVRLSAAALTWRGPSGAPSFVDDLAPALDAFRNADFTQAAHMLAPLGQRYPGAIEPPFYRGISLLYLDEPAAALDELQRAERIADDTFATDVAWYLAVAEQRSGRIGDARRRLESLCRAGRAHAGDACDGMKKLPAGR